MECVEVLEFVQTVGSVPKLISHQTMELVHLIIYYGVYSIFTMQFLWKVGLSKIKSYNTSLHIGFGFFGCFGY